MEKYHLYPLRLSDEAPSPKRKCNERAKEMNTKEEEPKDVEPNHGEQIESLNEAVDPAKKRRQADRLEQVPDETKEEKPNIMEMLHGMIKAKEADAQTIAKVAKETVATEERAEALKKKAKDAIKQLENERIQMAQMKDKEAQLVERTATLERGSADAKKNNKELSFSLNCTEIELERVQKEKDDMKVMNDNEKKKISELVEELEKVKADCAALQLEVKNKNTKLEEVVTKLTAAEGEKDAMATQVENITAELKNIEKYTDEMESNFKEETQKLQRKEEELNNQVLQHEAGLREEFVKFCKTQTAAEEARQEEVQKVRREIDNIKKKNVADQKRMGIEKEHLRQQNTELMNKLHEETQKAARMKEENDNMLKEYENRMRELEKKQQDYINDFKKDLEKPFPTPKKE